MIVDCAVYEQGQRRDGRVPLSAAFEAARQPGHFVWIGLLEPSYDELAAVATEFELHELAIEDAVNAHQRTKLEIYDGTLFMVLKPAAYDDANEVIRYGEVMVFLGDTFVITVRHGELLPLSEVRKELESRPDMLGCGPSTVLHAIIDRVVDGYVPVAEGIDADLLQVEADVFSPVFTNPSERIHRLKRLVLEFHRHVHPLMEPVQRLAEGRYPQVHDDVQPYYRDVADHLLRLSANVDNMRELLNSVLEANLAQISVRQNDDMKKMSAWAAIFLLPTVLVGVWGMNFKHMPELDKWWGYPMAIGVILGSCTLLWLRLKKSGWL